MNRTAFRSVAVTVVGFAIAVLTSACAGFSPEEAAIRCEQERDAREGGGCFDDTAMEECTAAYEECGEDVTIDDSCPLSFTCAD